MEIAEDTMACTNDWRGLALDQQAERVAIAAQDRFDDGPIIVLST